MAKSKKEINKTEEQNKSKFSLDNLNFEESLGEIKSEQIYTKEVLTDFIDYTTKSNKSTVVIYICAVLILMCAIAMFAFNDIYSGIIYTILGLFFMFYSKFVKFIMLKNNKKNIGNKDFYIFGENTLTINTFDTENKQMSSTTILYENLYEVKKYKSYGFIYVNKAVAYIVNLQNFKDIVDFNFALVRIEKAINAKKMQYIK